MKPMYFEIYSKDHEEHVMDMLKDLGFRLGEPIISVGETAGYIYTNSAKQIFTRYNKMVCTDITYGKATLDDLYRIHSEVREPRNTPFLEAYQVFELPPNRVPVAVGDLHHSHEDAQLWIADLNNCENPLFIQEIYYR
jgi:hypothetical protein